MSSQAEHRSAEKRILGGSELRELCRTEVLALVKCPTWQGPSCAHTVTVTPPPTATEPTWTSSGVCLLFLYILATSRSNEDSYRLVTLYTHGDFYSAAPTGKTP